jgi:hypothetical protein
MAAKNQSIIIATLAMLFLSQEEVETAISKGQPGCMWRGEDYGWTDKESVYVFHYARYHYDARSEIKVGHGGYTSIDLLRKQYGKGR